MSKLYYKGAVNSEGQLTITDPVGVGALSQATPTYEEAKALLVQDCIPVVVQVVRVMRVTETVESLAND